MRPVAGAEKLNFFLAEFDLGGRHRLFDMSHFAGTDDGRCQSRLMQQPGVSNSGIAFAALGGKLAETLHYSEVFFPIDQVVVVLHRNEPHPAIRLGNVMGLGKLPGLHAGGPNITHFPRFDEIMQGFHFGILL